MRTKTLIALSLLCLVSPALGAPKYTIKIATVAPTGTTWVNELEKTNQALLKASGGELGFQIYAGGVLGDESDVVRKMRIGQVQAVAFTGMGLGEILPEVRVLDLPFLAQTDAQVDRLTDKLFDHFDRSYREKGSVLLGFVPVGFVYMLSETPIRSIEDLKKTKMWIWEGDPLARSLFQAAGVSGIPLSLPDVLTSLQTKLINAVYGTPLAVIALQWHTKVHWRTDLAITHSTGGLLITQVAFSKLPEKYQALLKSESLSLCKRLADVGRKENAEALKVLEKEGIRTAAVQSKDREAFEALAPKVAQAQVGKLFSAELLNQARAIAAK
jgi:TRAP-type C4-dicarboxylate transport system substrate-binding protein